MTWVKTLEDADKILKSDEPPDVCLLDLGLPDSLRHETFSKIPQMNETTAVLVLTGSMDGISNTSKIPVLSKNSLSEMLVKSIARALLSRPGGRWYKADRDITTLRELLMERSNASKG